MIETSKSPEKPIRFTDKSTPDSQISIKRKVSRLAPLKNRLRSSLSNYDEKEPVMPEIPKGNNYKQTPENNELLNNINKSFESRYDGVDVYMDNLLLEVDDIIAKCGRNKSTFLVRTVRETRKSPSKQQISYKKRSNSEQKPKNIDWNVRRQNQHRKNVLTSYGTSRQDLKLAKYTQDETQESCKRLDKHYKNHSNLLNDSKFTRRASRDSKQIHFYEDSPEDFRHSRNITRFGSTSSIGLNTDGQIYFNSEQVTCI